MRLLSARLLVPAGIVVVAWGGLHLLTSPGSLVAQPAPWPGANPSPPGPAAPLVAAAAAGATPSASAAAGPAVPLVAGLMQRLNGDTRETALGMSALITQLEGAVAGELEGLLRRLEPGR